MSLLQKTAFHWQMETGFAPILDELLVTDGSIVKESPSKRVTRHSVNGRDFYLKLYRHNAVPFRPVKFLFKPTEAAGEWKTARQLEALKIPIVRHLAMGERRSWRGVEESVLITEAFEGAPVDESAYVDSSALLRFINSMHEHGVLQRDLHTGNILVSERGEMRLVDLHGIKIKNLSSQDRAENLAFLRMTFPIPVSQEIQKLSEQMRKRHLFYRSKRCLKHNREFAPRKAGHLRWQLRLPFLTPELERILRDPDDFLATRAEILKPGRSSTVGCGDDVVLKRYNLRKVSSIAKDLFRASRAKRAFRKAYHLELAGVPTARAVSAADHRVARFLLRSYFVMEEISEAKHLGEWKGDATLAARRAAELLARLHNEGFSHRDLKETNLVFNGAGKLFLIDLEGLEFLGEVPHARASADLRRLARAAATLPQFARVHRVLFLREYCRRRRLRPHDFV